MGGDHLNRWCSSTGIEGSGPSSLGLQVHAAAGGLKSVARDSRLIVVAGKWLGRSPRDCDVVGHGRDRVRP